MRILHLLSQRPSHTGSGIAIQAMIREAAARGHENLLLCGVPDGEEPEPMAGTEIRSLRFKAGVPELAVPTRPSDLPFLLPGMSDVMPYPSTRFSDMSDAMLDAYEAAFAPAIEQAIADFAPDVFHAHHLWIVSALARRLAPNIPMLAQCHGSDLRQHAICPAISARLCEPLTRLDAVLALSRRQQTDIEALLDIPPTDIHVVGAGYRDALFQRGNPPSPPPVQLAYAGKLSRAKGVALLLEALATLEPASGAWHLHLYGATGGTEGAEVLERAEALGPAVTVHGAVSQEALAEGFKASHVFVLPSFFEGLPLVVLEALASGCRIVVTALPGVGELLDGLPEDIVRQVALPRLEHVDQPVAEDLPRFVSALAEALRAQIAASTQAPSFAQGPAKARLDAYRWPSVFARVEALYEELIDPS